MLDHRSWTSRARSRYVGGEQGLLSMAFAPDYATSHRFYVYYTDTTARARRVVTSTSASSPPNAAATRASPASEQRAAHDPASQPDQPQRRPAPVRPGRRPLHLAGRRRRRRTTPSQNAPEHSTRCSARSCASRPATGRPYTIPAGNPFAGRSPCSHGRHAAPTPRDLGLRAAQPVALLVRPRDRRPGRSATSARTRDEEIDFAHPGQNAGANYGWPCFEGVEPDCAGPGVGVHRRCPATSSPRC